MPAAAAPTRRTPAQPSHARTLRALTYLLEHDPPSESTVIVPKQWAWFGAGTSLRLTAAEAARCRNFLAAHPGDPSDPLGDCFQALLAGPNKTSFRTASRTSQRRRSGSFYTPPAIVEHLARIALTPLIDAAESRAGRSGILGLRILDPACGSGRFLLAAAELIAARAHCTRAEAAACVFGVDLDPFAAELARYNVSRWLGCHCSPATGGRSHAGSRPALNVHAADALLAPLPPSWPTHFHTILGNPPFLNQLESDTTRSRVSHQALAARFGPHLRPYTDTSALFLLRALELSAPGARIALIQPTSLLSARDAEPVRRALTNRGTLDALWTAGEQVFAAGVHVCAPIVTVTSVGHAARTVPLISPALRGHQCSSSITRYHGPAFTPRDNAALQPGASSWAPLIADTSDLPTFSIRMSGTLADLASATADFRDQFYGLRGCIVEDADLTPAQRRTFPRLITTGLIDPLANHWGLRPCKLLGQLWNAPRADPEALERAGLGPWSRQRLVPKILLATQTRTLELVIDEAGDLLPVTPIITITPLKPGDLHRLTAALLSPSLTAQAVRHHAGAGLSPGAIKLSAKQVLALPLPAPCPEWDEAARLLSGCHCSPSSEQQCETTQHDSAVLRGQSAASSGTQARLLAAAELMCRAYALTEHSPGSLLAWWRARLAPRRPYKSPL